MENALLSKNEGKTGSYTINVRNDYAIPKLSLKEILHDDSTKTIKRSSKVCNISENKK